jgi:hypothetical protein
VSSIDPFIGTFEGTGAWHDSAGQSQGYRIRQTNAWSEQLRRTAP